MHVGALRVGVFAAAVGVSVFAFGSGCGPPDSFSGLVGGDGGTFVDTSSFELERDSNLAPPRPVAPLSLSWINGSRPSFKWQLPGEATGARVELCRTRACDDGDKKSIEVAGDDLELADELESGIWFWRLLSRTPESIGTTFSPTWAFLVRARARNGSAPNGSFVDINGDGRADLIASVEVEGDAGANAVLVALLATNDDSTSFDTSSTGLATSNFAPSSTDAPFGVNDIDGDGLSDVAFAHFDEGKAANALVVVFGSPRAKEGGDEGRAVSFDLPPLDSSLFVTAGGDLDGDGWGDVLVTDKANSVVMFGDPSRHSQFSYLFWLLPNRSSGAVRTAPLAALGGFDRQGDGLTDAIFGFEYDFGHGLGPIASVAGNAHREYWRVPSKLKPGLPAVTEARAFASGDFDADGLADSAFLTTIDSAPGVCIERGSEYMDSMTLICWAPATASAGFASSIAAADVDADGRDDILVGSSDAGVDILSLSESLEVTAEHVDTPFGARLTTVLPGHSKKEAVWAATSSNGDGIAVFRGKKRATTLALPPGVKRFGTIR